jgi:calpain family cysteine protease
MCVVAPLSDTRLPPGGEERVVDPDPSTINGVVSGGGAGIECMRAAFDIVSRHQAAVPEGHFLYENVFPVGKDGMPTVNPSGKYVVQLFVCGAWRIIVVDDRVPIADSGAVLIPSSSVAGELWPLLLSKALLKVAAALGHSTVPPAAALHWLTGWTPSSLSAVSGSSQNEGTNLWVRSSTAHCLHSFI